MLSPWHEIGNRLRAYRLSKNFTAAELAEKIGVSRAALYRLEQGEVVKVETLERLAKLLDVSLPALMGVGVEYYASAVGFYGAAPSAAFSAGSTSTPRNASRPHTRSRTSGACSPIPAVKTSTSRPPADAAIAATAPATRCT